MTMHGVLKALFSAVLLIGTIGSVSAVELVDPATETIVFRHADVLGSPVATTDDQGRVLWYENSTAYGDSLGRRAAGGRGFGDNAALNPDVQVGYTGHSNDTASGLNYMKARYYDPAIGRFYSNDPIGFNTENLAMFNRYAYANNNPYRYIDPDGKQSEDVDGDNDGDGDVDVDDEIVGFIDNSLGNRIGIDPNGLVLPPSLVGPRKTPDPKKLPDDALVARGGANITPKSIAEGVANHPAGVTGFSAQCNGGTCTTELGVK